MNKGSDVTRISFGTDQHYCKAPSHIVQYMLITVQLFK